MADAPTPPIIDSAERRQATVLFADISGFTAMSETLDPEDVRDLMNTCFARIEEIVHERGGVVDKWIGDCVMALFGARTALERAPLYACDAALAIRDAVREVSRQAQVPEPLDVHLGIDTGLVVAGEMGGAEKHDFTVMGRVVNMAARLEDKAANGEILVGAETRRATRQYFQYSEPIEFELKGIEGTVPGYYLKGYIDSTVSWKQVGGRRAQIAPLIGRRGELQRLTDFAARLAAGKGGAMALWGEGGLGKSRLVAELLAGLPPASVRAHVGYGIPVGCSMSFHPFAGLLTSWIAEVLGEEAAREESARSEFTRAVIGREDPEVETGLAVILGAPLTAREREGWRQMSPDAQERFVHTAVARLFQTAAQSRPFLIVMEDLYWADDSSLTLLEFLLPLARRHPIGFLLVSRPGYEQTGDRVAQHAKAMLAGDWEEVSLEALSLEDTSTLLRHLLRSPDVPRSVIEAISDRAAGNPLFVQELVEDLIERGALVVTPDGVQVTAGLRTATIPQSIEGVVLSRAERLSPEARATLDHCAVLGRQFLVPVLALVEHGSDGLEDRLVELLDAGFLVPARPAAVVAATAATAGRRTYEFRHSLLQESIYQAILKKRRRELHAACARAIESLQADDLAPSYSILAYHYLLAEELERAEAYLFRAGERAAASASSREALRYFRDAYDAYTRMHGDKGDPKRRALLEKQIGLALLNTGRLVESIPHLNASLELHGERVPQTALQLNLKVVADLLVIVFDLYLRGSAPRKSRGREDDRELFEILYNRCRALNPTDPRRAFFDNIAAIRHLRHMDAATVPYACGIYAAAGAFFAFSGLSFPISAKFLTIARKLADSGSETDRFQYAAMSFLCAYLSGEWSGSDRMTPQLLEGGLRSGLLWDADTYLGIRAELEIKQGRFEEAEATIAVLERLYEHFGYSFSEANVLANRAYLLTERDSLEQAWSAVNRYYESRDEDTLRLIALSTRAKIETRMGKHAEAAETLRLADRIVARAGRISPYYESAYVSAALLAAVSQYERSLAARTGDAWTARRRSSRLLERAMKLTRKIARDSVQVYALAGRYAFGSGDRKGAERWWHKARTTAEALGAVPDGLRLTRDEARCREMQADRGQDWA